MRSKHFAIAGLAALLCLAGCSQGFNAARGINIISREEGSGTRDAFVDLFEVKSTDAEGNKLDMTTLEASITNSTSVVINTVARDEHAIGYISYGSMSDMVKAVSIDGVAVSAASIKSGEYRIARPFNIVTDKLDNPAAEDFILYILSAEGQAVVEENSYVAAASDAAAYKRRPQSGKVVVAGSSSVTPVMEKLAEAYMALNPNVSIELQQSDSSTGIQSVVDGISDIGMASRELKDSEAALTATVIALDGIVVIVNKQNPTDNLSTEQVQGIFTGEITTWSETE